MKIVSQKRLIISTLLLGILIVNSSLQAIFSSFTFVRFLNVMVIVFLSVAVGAFIREMFLLKK